MAAHAFSASPEQISALENANQSFAASQERHTKEWFIYNFLQFCGRIAGRGGGAYTHISKGLDIFLENGHSKHIAVPTEDVPNQGIEIDVYSAVVRKEKDHQTRKPLGKVAVGAEVMSGLIVDGTFPKLAGKEAILRVSSMPPLVMYKHGDGELAVIEPNSEAWTEMSELTDMLMSREAELTSQRT